MYVLLDGYKMKRLIKNDFIKKKMHLPNGLGVTISDSYLKHGSPPYHFSVRISR